jgi:putative iron-regulated protein
MKFIKLAACITSASLLIACGGDDDNSSSAPAINVEKAQLVLNTNADIALAAYTDSVETAKTLKVALETFRAASTQANLDAAKTAWLVSREPYGQTEVYRFRNTPVDSLDVEGDLNAWPLGEALIDYVSINDSDFGADQVGVVTNGAGINPNADGELVDNPDTEADETTDNNGSAVDGSNDTQNIIATSAITINAELIGNTATASDEHDVIAGYHAIEFLLWGQDLNESGNPTNGNDRDDAVKSYALGAGGQRPLADFDSNIDNDAADRRHQYLAVVVDKLITDLEAVQAGWAKNVEGNYRATFTTIANEADAKQKLTEILTGMGTLSEGELAGERMQIAFSSNSQEDEHSCFSDNTHRDISLNAEGVSNSFYGSYAGYDSTLNGEDDVTTNAVDGYGIDEYLTEVGLTGIAVETATALTLTQTNYNLIDASARAGAPFDVLIMSATETNPVALTIKSLNAQSRLIQDTADQLGLGIVVEADASDCNTASPTTGC